MNALEDFIFQLLAVADDIRRTYYWTNDLGQTVRVVMRDPQTGVLMAIAANYGDTVRVDRDNQLHIEPMFNVRIYPLCCTLKRWESA